jgi:peptide/nickel transport system permease protein
MMGVAAAVGRPSGLLIKISRQCIRNPELMVGCSIVVLVLGAALIAPLLAPYSPVRQAFSQQLQPPSAVHVFGTDEFGRDIFTRVLYGARIALAIGLVSDAIAALLGTLLGVVSGYFGGRVDAAVMRMVDVMLAFPYILLAMVVIAVLGPGLANATIAIGIVYTPQFARLVRGAVLGVRHQEFVAAAVALGANSARVLRRHVVPSILSPILVMATLTVGFTLIETAALSFLGLGANPPTPEWGTMLATGRAYMLSAPWVATFPGIGILTTVVGFNLMGDGLRDLIDPRLRARHW